MAPYEFTQELSDAGFTQGRTVQREPEPNGRLGEAHGLASIARIWHH